MVATASYYTHMAEEAKAAQAVIDASRSAEVVIDDDNVAAPMLTKAMSAVETDMALHKGIPIFKLSTRGVWKHRILTLSSDKLAFFITHHHIPKSLLSVVGSSLPVPLWTPRRGFKWSNDSDRYIRHIDIADIDTWQSGVIDTLNLEYAKRSIHQRQIHDLVTIFHNGYQESLSFRVSNSHFRKALLRALPLLQQTYRLVVPWIAQEQLLLRYIYYDIDADKNGMVSLKEFRDTCGRINLNFQEYEKLFAESIQIKAESSKRRQITCAETRNLLNSIISKDSPAILLWDSLFGANTTHIASKQFREKFLVAVQAESNVSSKDAALLIDSLKALGHSEELETISKSEFVHFLFSKYNAAYDPWATGIPTTQEFPMSHYWINTSHNTYLTGDQLQSRSSVVAYVKALHRGCKCLELDCWDGPDDKNFMPVVYHGHTLTSKIDFRSICLVVNNYLEANPTTCPIILSLENHCSSRFQRTMAAVMKKIFQKKLFVPTAAHTSGGKLPSPEELRGMIVIKGKRAPDPEEDQVIGEGIPETKSSEDDGDDVDEYDKAIESSGNKGSEKIDPELARLTLFHGTKYKDFNKSIQDRPSHMHSIGETKITKILSKSKDNARLWRKYNVNHMTRTYPSGSRVDSSNYNPVVAWAMGCQLVALNFQTHDTPLLLNDGHFRQAGGCGYVVKPNSLMGGTSPKKLSIQISILSARCVPKPKRAVAGEVIDPYVTLDLHDVRVTSGKEEYASSSFKTSVVENNGFCPIWNDAVATFEVHNPDVAMLVFKVYDQDYVVDDYLASASIPVSKIRKGYRSVMLYDDNNTRTGPLQSTVLFVKIEY